MECSLVPTLAQALAAISLSVPAAAPSTPLLAAERTVGLWGLFAQSFDLFTIVLLGGSFAAVAIIARCVIDIRPAKIQPKQSLETLRSLMSAGRYAEVREFARNDGSFASKIVYAALAVGAGTGAEVDRSARREAAELAASSEVGRWFRKIEPLNVIGQLGPLVGLAGTVWGMIVAFTSLSASGGQADPSILSAGISKALFHTLLGLCLATPCLIAYFIFRSMLDRLSNRSMLMAGIMLEGMPDRVALPRQTAG